MARPTLYVCTNRRVNGNASCAGRGGEELVQALRSAVAARKLGWSVAENRCMGHCHGGPNLKAAPNGPLLHGCRAEQADSVVERLLNEWIPAADDVR